MFGVIALTTMLFAAPFLSIPVHTAFAQQGKSPAEEKQTLPTNGEKEDITLEAMSADGNTELTVNWTPADIGQPNTFSFIFADPDGTPVSPMYTIEILQNNQTVPGTLREDQTTMVQEYTFSQPGNYTMKIHDMQDRRPTEVINIPLQVPPESPSATSNSTSSNITNSTAPNLIGSLLPMAHSTSPWDSIYQRK